MFEIVDNFDIIVCRPIILDINSELFADVGEIVTVENTGSSFTWRLRNSAGDTCRTRDYTQYGVLLTDVSEKEIFLMKLGSVPKHILDGLTPRLK